MIRYLVTFCLFLYASSAQSETFELKCLFLRGSTGAAKGSISEYLIDSTKKLVKFNDHRMQWMRTLYWGDDYIVAINGEDNMAFGENDFVQSDLFIIELNSMIKYQVFITPQTFSTFQAFRDDPDFSVAPIFVVSQCTRGF